MRGGLSSTSVMLHSLHYSLPPFLHHNHNKNRCLSMGKRRASFCQAASSSFTGSDGSRAGSINITEPLFGARKKKKKNSVAGIDQDELLDPKLLADADSCFCEFNGVHIHHKIFHHHQQQQEEESSQTNNLGVPMVLLHGFGASLFSWERVAKPLARLVGSKVLAFDRPAFGLTSRITRTKLDAITVNPYSLAFSVLATLYFINSLSAEKVILTGHSAGCLVAVNTYFKAPKRIVAMILVAPAILAPHTSSKVVKENQAGAASQTEDGISDSNAQQNQLMRICNILSKFLMYILQFLKMLLKGIVNMIHVLYKKALIAILRSSLAVILLRMVIDKFGVASVRNAWYDGSLIKDHTINGYIKPLRTKGWDTALLEHTVAMLVDSGPESESKTSLRERLSDITCPVLIITGDSDRIVPAWNANKLSQAIPGSSLEIIEKCGHLPHEERVEEFVSIVHKFLRSVADDQNPQAPS